MKQLIKYFYKKQFANSSIDDYFRKNFNLLFRKKYLTKKFWEWYNFLDEAYYWEEAKVQEFQLEKIKDLINYAYNNTEYFKHIFNEYDIKPKRIQTFDDYRKLPFSNRHLFMEKKDELLSKSFDLNKCRQVKTSGTVGNPLVFYKPYENFSIELATIFNFWKRIGFKPTDKRIVINGDILSDNKPWVYSTGNYIRFSPNKIGKERVKSYLKIMEKYGANYLHGYPSAISLMAKVIKENNLILPFQLKGVFLASEPIYKWQREVIGNVFSCRVFSHYGNTEDVALAGECEKSSVYHFSSFHSYVELDNKTNEIIGTSFWNYANPFIRHKTNDIAKVLEYNTRCSCGRNGFLIESVEGRQGDYLVSLKDEFIFPQAVTWILYGIETIKETQIIQHKDYSLLVRFIPYHYATKNKLQSDLSSINNRLLDMMSGSVKIDFEQNEFIESAARGKIRWIKSEISEGQIEKGIL